MVTEARECSTKAARARRASSGSSSRATRFHASTATSAASYPVPVPIISAVSVRSTAAACSKRATTLDSSKRAEHSRVYNLVGPELALDHVGAGRPEFGHRFKPANQLLFLYRRGGASTTNQTDIRSVTAIVRSAVLQRAGRAAAQPSTLTADAASRALSQQAAGARIDVDGAAGAAGRARTSPSPDLYNRGDRDRARGRRFACRGHDQIVARPLATLRAGRARRDGLSTTRPR